MFVKRGPQQRERLSEVRLFYVDRGWFLEIQIIVVQVGVHTVQVFVKFFDAFSFGRIVEDFEPVQVERLLQRRKLFIYHLFA